MTRFTTLPLAVLMLLLPSAAGAEMYQWTDDKGVKHYANSPPPAGNRTDSSWGEIKAGEAGDQDLKTREAAIIKETEAADRQAEIDAAAAKQKKDQQKALETMKEEQEALGNSIDRKRRYIKRRGKTDINKIRRLNGEIEALKKDRNADPGKIKELEAEVQEIKEKFYIKSGRGRKGTRQEVERYFQLEMEIQRKKEEAAAQEKK